MVDSKKTSVGETKRTLDLGIGEIIASTGDSRSTTEVKPSITPLTPPHRGDVGDQQKKAPAKPPLSEYAELAERGAWAQIVALTEARTAGGGSGDLAARFWWVRSSVALGTVPLSIAAAPLESVTCEIAESKKRGTLAPHHRELVGIAAVFLSEVGSKLAAQRDMSTACAFAERAYRLDGGMRSVLENIVGEVLRGEAPSPRRDPAGTRLRARCEELRRELGSSAPVVGAPAAAPAQAPVQKPLAASPSAFNGAAPERASRSSGWGSVFGFAVMCALGFGLYFVRFGSGGEAVDALTSISLVGVDVSPEISPPALERLSTVSQLDAIFYDFDRGGGAREAPRRERVPSPVAPAVGGKAAVDTAGPLEPVDVLKARTQPEEPPEEDVGAILFGAPKPQFPGRYGSGRGGVTPQPVERFTDVKNYTVLSRTRVMSRPSFTGIEMAELSVGDSVRAEGSVGDWLRIRSRNGQVGYILSQDVQPPR